ncbi:MAG: hypothetical protein PHY54_13785 [Methylococcales bacterium]|nr:hypothetical protein [Methylococcales bacterium]
MKTNSSIQITDVVMNSAFWIGVQTTLTKEMLEFAASKIESFSGMPPAGFIPAGLYF